MSLIVTKLEIPHVSPETLCEATDIQVALRAFVEVEDQLSCPPRTVAGVDVAYDTDSDRVAAAVVVLDFDSLKPIERSSVVKVVSFPYVPGLFAFRELPPIIAALEKLDVTPDLLVCDGHGLAHPRRFGVACHLGVLSGLPTIGVAKSLLVGDYVQPGPRRGDWSPIFHEDAVIGCALRTQHKVKPVFVSVGHRVSLQSARAEVLRLCSQYRLPETTRQADRHARLALKEGA